MVPSGTSITQTNLETMKLLNEVFVAGDDQWQESIKTFVISLYLSDLSSSIPLDKLFKDKKTQLVHQYVILFEDLKNINLVNFDE